MPLEHFIIWAFCIIDNSVHEITNGTRLRKRGFDPTLSDSEVVTMEIVGEFIGIGTDKGIWEYFRIHWLDLFPALGSRSAFAKQAANLVSIKEQVQMQLADSMGAIKDPVHIVDGFPIPICHFRRAKRCRSCWEGATYGYCASKDETYYGFHG
ncbi:IS982 family transposase, partial [Magnetococcales bacterium HHB-1]